MYKSVAALVVLAGAVSVFYNYGITGTTITTYLCGAMFGASLVYLSKR